MRKTNLFYLEDNQTNFLTFSNYGEYLTGTSLSTNHKIFPSSFICLNLPFDSDNHTLTGLKKLLMQYYENKLAWLRDQCDNKNWKWEEKLNPLSYLFETLYLYFNDIPNFELNGCITYYGDIVEHDYNGSYSDSICIVDFNKFKNFFITLNDEINYSLNDTNNPLHGWIIGSELPENPNFYEIVENQESSENKYSSEQLISYNLSSDQLTSNTIEFNCIIPLFNVTNISIDENNYNINEKVIETDDIYQNIPYGIWFSDVENNDGELIPIKLYKRNDNISQSWSLVISSKFSPYPYGIKMNSEEKQIDIEKYTYAELLAKQSQILENYNELIKQLQNLNETVNTLNTKVKNIEQLYPNNTTMIIDNVNNQLESFRKEMIDMKNDINNTVEEYFEQLKWKTINTYNTNGDD